MTGAAASALFDVLGARVAVHRDGSRWQASDPGAGGKRRPVHDIRIPAELREDRLLACLDGLRHERAGARHPR